jgi:hypothetical protein
VQISRIRLSDKARMSLPTEGHRPSGETTVRTVVSALQCASALMLTTANATRRTASASRVDARVLPSLEHVTLAAAPVPWWSV